MKNDHDTIFVHLVKPISIHIFVVSSIALLGITILSSLNYHISIHVDPCENTDINNPHQPSMDGAK